MHDRAWLRTCVALAMLMVGLSNHAFAQTIGANSLVSEPLWEVKDTLTAAKEAAARAARSSRPLTLPKWKSAGSFLTIDAPGAVHGTFVSAVNSSGAVTGSYSDVNYLFHGFLLASNGKLVTIDVPGAVGGTLAVGINDEGAIVGTYGDNVGAGRHSFLREPDGTIFTFDPVPNLESVAKAVNGDGTTTGWFYDANSLVHGYLRTPSGKFTTFAVPGANNTAFPFGTEPMGITADKIIGLYSHGTRITSGFLLDANGRLTEITGPGGLGGQYDPENDVPAALSVNSSGEIAGTYFAPISGNPFGGDYRVFVRSRDGTYVTFHAANYSPCCIWSAPSGINSAGTVTGSFNDGFSINHGFWRTRYGTVTPFDVPGAGTGVNEGTLPTGINAEGVIVGIYVDATHLTHGFLFRPK